MKISKYIHSCLVIEEAGKRLLIDPGEFSFIEKKVAPEGFKDIDAVLITHEHADHASPSALKIILANNPAARVHANAGVAKALASAGIEEVTVVSAGDQEIAGIPVRAIPAQHESIPFPVPENTAFIIGGRLLHPGDSYDVVLEESKAEILALPITAPWGTWNDAIAFAVRQKPKFAFPIHDGFIKDFFLESRHARTVDLLAKEGIEFKPLREPGESVIY